MKRGTMRFMAGKLALCTIAMLGGISSAQDSFRIFPPRSMVQCVIDGKAIAEFPTTAALNEKFGENAKMAGGFLESSLRDKITFYAFASLPCRNAADDTEDDYNVIFYVGLSKHTTFEEFRNSVSGIVAKNSHEGKSAKGKTEGLADGGLRIVVYDDDKDTPSSFCIVQATPALAIGAESEEEARAAAELVKGGLAFCPKIPGDNPLAWLSASINPEELFGDEDDAGSDSSFGGMEYLGKMTNIVVVADGDMCNGDIRLSAIAKFSATTSAEQAAGMLSAIIQWAAISGNAANPLAALGKRAKVFADAADCRHEAVFPANDIQAFFTQMADMAQSGVFNDD